MTTVKSPFNMSDMLKMFDPEKITKRFDPKRMNQMMLVAFDGLRGSP